MIMALCIGIYENSKYTYKLLSERVKLTKHIDYMLTPSDIHTYMFYISIAYR